MSSFHISSSVFGQTPEGREISLFILKNPSGTCIKITNYGGIIVSILAKDRLGNLDEIVLGYDSLDDYLKDPAYFGAIIGRYANRIAKGQFELDGKTYQLTKNNFPNHLHGGQDAFHRQIWNASTFQNEDSIRLQLHHLSPNGAEGYPGNLDCTVTYTLNKNNELIIDYNCVSDQKTVLNLTNHSYFNLKDGGRTPIEDHELTLYSNYITPVDDNLIPLGQKMAVEQSPFDFRTAKKIGRDIDKDHAQLRLGSGYDHNFILVDQEKSLKKVAAVYEKTTGRILEVWTTEPGCQLYTANHMNGSIVGKTGIAYPKRAAFCLETQHFPDAPNQPDFPTTVLEPHQKFHSQTIYRFSSQLL